MRRAPAAGTRIETETFSRWTVGHRGSGWKPRKDKTMTTLTSMMAEISGSLHVGLAGLGWGEAPLAVVAFAGRVRDGSSTSPPG